MDPLYHVKEIVNYPIYLDVLESSLSLSIVMVTHHGITCLNRQRQSSDLNVIEFVLKP